MKHRFAVAPMLAYTDTHMRTLCRLVSDHAALYTEMVSVGSLLKGVEHTRRLSLQKQVNEDPVVFQLGGCDPETLARCARMVEQAGFNGVNLNCGCPSDRACAGDFGASLMADAERVGRCVDAMARACSIDISVKCRIGIEMFDCTKHTKAAFRRAVLTKSESARSEGKEVVVCEANREMVQEREEDERMYAFVKNFLETVHRLSGVDKFTIHARKAILGFDLTPDENRKIPRLQYDVVHRLKRELPQFHVTLNGGIGDLDAGQQQLEHVDGVMLGRAVTADTLVLRRVDRLFFSGMQSVSASRTVRDIVALYQDHMEREVCDNETPFRVLAKPLLSLLNGIGGARIWRQVLSDTKAHQEMTVAEIVKKACEPVDWASVEARYPS
eukprot:ANDGO_05359.mRNA.1 tRNA-dihydrouridine(20/20a) synthase